MSEERDPDLNEDEDIRLDEIREERCRDVAEEGDDEKKIHSLRWEVYIKEKEELINRKFSVSVPHPKGGAIFWTCVKDHIINEREDYKYIGLCGFDYKLFEEEGGEGDRKGLDGYPHLKHIIQLWPVYWDNKMYKLTELLV